MSSRARSVALLGGDSPGLLEALESAAATLTQRGWRVHVLAGQSEISAAATLVRHRPALLHFDCATAALKRLNLIRMRRCGWVVSLGEQDLGLPEPAEVGKVLARADALIFRDGEVRNLAVTRGLAPADRTFVLDPACDPASVRPADRSGRIPGQMRIVSTGRLSWTEGYEHGLQAVRLLIDSGVKCEYRVLGTGDYEGALHYAIYQLDLGSTVEILRPETGHRLLGHLHWADTFLSPAVATTSPPGLREATAAALPVVATDAPRARDGPRWPKDAVVVERRDSWAMSDALMQLARDPGLRERLGQAARLEAVRLYDGRDELTQVEEVYGLLAR